MAMGNTGSRAGPVSWVSWVRAEAEMLDSSTSSVTRSMAGTHSEADWKLMCW